MRDIEYIGGIAIGEWVMRDPEYMTIQFLGRQAETIMVREGFRMLIPRHFDDWMRERNEAAHQAMMAHVDLGGARYT